MRKKVLLKNVAVILLSLLLFTALTAAPAAEETIPTIYLDDEVWYKYSLLPLIVKGDDYCVPVSVFDGYASINYGYNKEYETHLFEDDGGMFLSVKNDGSSYSSTGIKKNIAFFEENGQFYISASAVAEVFGLLTESGNYYGTDVIRISREPSELSLKNLVDFSKKIISVPSSEPGNDGDDDSGQQKDYKGSFAVIADFTVTDFDTTFALLSAIEETETPVTAEVNRDFLKNPSSRQVLARLAAAGCGFAIKAADGKDEADFCSDLLYEYFGERTLLVTSNDAEAFRGTVYTVTGTYGLPQAEETSADIIAEKKLPIVILNTKNISCADTLRKLAKEASENYILITSANRITGKQFFVKGNTLNHE